MTQMEITAFLTEGAFLRVPNSALMEGESQVLLWKAPFESVGIENSSNFSVSYQDFFGSQVTALKTVEEPSMVSVKSLRQDCQRFYKDQDSPGMDPDSTSLSRKDFEDPKISLFQEAYQVIQGKIHRGEIEKAVPVVFSSSNKIPNIADRARMLDRVLEAFDGLHVFGFWQGEMGIIGATPEILFHQKNSKISSMALAGTCPKADADTRLNLLKDHKEMHEHGLVIKDIQERLSKWGWVRLGETEIVEFPGLLHLRTNLEVQATKVSCFDIIKQLHPTPALGVYPRNYGIQWLRELPYQQERNLFGGPITFRLSEDEVLSLVAIRNLHWHSHKSFIGSGCGIVAESDFSREWDELSMKRESVFKVLGL